MAQDGHSWDYATIYQIFIDRFANKERALISEKPSFSPQFYGGTLKGITANIPYLKDIGVSDVLITPHMESSEYHGYAVTDYFKVDPRFGTERDLSELVSEMHRNDMRLIADFVPNHCSDQHPLFQDARKNPQSPYRNWFTFFENGDYFKFMYFDTLPKFNLENPQAREYITQAAKHWLSLGVDDLRLDHAIGPSHDFWQYFRNEVKRDYPNATLIGEIWPSGMTVGDLPQIGMRNKEEYIINRSCRDLEGPCLEYAGQLDGVLDFKFWENMICYGLGWVSEEEIQERNSEHFERLAGKLIPFTQKGNHDTDRYILLGGEKRLVEANAIQLIRPEPAIIYYGEESGMRPWKSKDKHAAHGDLESRQPMNWGAFNSYVFNNFKNSLEMRQAFRDSGMYRHEQQYDDIHAA